MKPEYSLFIGIFFVISFPDQIRSQTTISCTEEKGNGKQNRKKEPPTFIGSDGVVRKVSPSAILEEMKRCLPPGLPIPIETAWPELPPHLEALQEAKDPKNEPQGTLDGFQNLKDPEEPKTINEKKRVSRSNDKNMVAADVTQDESMNVKLEGPSVESGAFPPKDLDQHKMAEVLKCMLARQMRRQNMTAEYVDDFSVRPRNHKHKTDDYEDYDFIDPVEPKMTHAKVKTHQRSRDGTSRFQTRPKQQRKTKRENRWKYSPQKSVRKSQMNRLKKKHDYEYDYEESGEDGSQKYTKHQQQSPLEGRIQSDELEKQIELNDFLEKHLPEEIRETENTYQTKGSDHIKAEAGGNLGIVEGYQKMLAVITKLNTTLIHLLDKFTSLFHKGQTRNHHDSGPSQSDDSGKTSVMWDFMDLLMQQRRSTRNKRENGPYMPENVDKTAEVPNSALDKVVEPSTSRTSMDLLKWLLKWYVTATSK